AALERCAQGSRAGPLAGLRRRRPGAPRSAQRGALGRALTPSVIYLAAARRPDMPGPDFVIYEDEFRQLEEALRRLRHEANAKAVFLIDKNGQQIASAGEVEQFDTTSLASLTAGNVAATDGLAKLIGEREFSVLFHEGQQDHIHISIVSRRAIVVVIFDDRSSLGLVRLRVTRASVEMERIFDAMTKKGEAAQSGGEPSPFSEITEEDIDALFSE